MKYGLFAAVALAFVALTGGTASAGGATSGLTKSTVAMPSLDALKALDPDAVPTSGGRSPSEAAE